MAVFQQNQRGRSAKVAEYFRISRVVVKYIYFHKRKAYNKMGTQVKRGFLSKEPCIVPLVHYCGRESADSMTARGNFAP